MSKKLSNKHMLKMNTLDLYKILLDLKTSDTFPAGYWTRPRKKEDSLICLKYLLHERLNYDDYSIKKYYSSSFLKQYKLYECLHDLYGGSPYSFINSLYPSKFNEWEFKRVPNGFWNRENSIDAVKWLVEKSLIFLKIIY